MKKASLKVTAVDVAKYLIFLASNEEEQECLSPMRLQKLLYYVQGWSLAERGVPMFDDAIEAWAHGPVVPRVYREFKDDGMALPAERGSSSTLDKSTSDFVRSVWDAYKPYSAISLSEMTHNEQPWKSARVGVASGAASKKQITIESMKAFFETLSKKSA